MDEYRPVKKPKIAGHQSTEEGEQGMSFDSLPYEIIHLILLFATMGGKVVCTFIACRFVCKQWRDLLLPTQDNTRNRFSFENGVAPCNETTFDTAALMGHLDVLK